MRLFDIFRSGPMSEARITKAAALASNAYAQPDVRMRELERLMKENTEAALSGALKRFSTNAQGHIADEEEKQWLEDAMVEAGERAVAPLCTYIGAEKQLTYALRALFRIVGESRASQLLMQVLRTMLPDNWQKSEAKQQIIWQLAPLSRDPEVLSALLPYLGDHSDDVQWAVLEAVGGLLDEGQAAPEPGELLRKQLGQLVSDDVVSLRIARRAAELSLDHQLLFPSQGVVAKALQDHYFIDKKQYLRRRAS